MSPVVPYLESSGEHKSKPTQHSVKELQSFGIMPDVIVTRCNQPIDESVMRKIAAFCNVKPDCVIQNITLPVLYAAPIMLEEAGLANIVMRELRLTEPHPCDLTEWKAMLSRVSNAKRSVRIALVGKYVKLHDSYLSVAEALKHGGYENGAEVKIDWVDSEKITAETAKELLGEADGIIVPGGFGSRGIEGMIEAARFARENRVPYFGICLGMQIAAIEFGRHVLGYADANSREFDPDSRHLVIDLMPDQQGNLPKGGTMRLGAYPCHIAAGSKLAAAYGQDQIAERHRHRYEFGNEFRKAYEAVGAVFSGLSPDGRLVEAMELPEYDFYIGVQYHPEFKSRPNKAHPLFKEFIRASLQRQKGNE